MELRHLRYFVAVAEALNFTRAAERLHTAQPSLSQQIRQLEAEVGVALLARSKRHVALTPAGRAFLDEARLVLAQAERAMVLARKAAGAGAGRLRVGFVPAAEVKLFPRLLPMLRAQFPELELSFHSLTTAEQRVALLDRHIDIGFLRPPLADPVLDYCEVMRERLVLVLPADHPLATAETLTPEAIARADFVRINPAQAGQALHEAIQSCLHEHNLDLPVAQEVHNVLTLLTLIGMGGGLTLLPDYAEQLVFRNVVTRAIPGKQTLVPLLMAWRRDDPHPAGRSFRALVTELGHSGATAGMPR